MFLFRMRGTVRICQCGNRFPMGDISKALKNSADLLQAVWEKQETQVAEGIRWHILKRHSFSTMMKMR